MKTKNTLLTIAVVTALGFALPLAYSQPATGTPERGPGMMGNYGPGQGQGGYGPGMMGGGYGPGGGYGYGQGMMGRSYGPGMMGSGGYGHGMMGGYAYGQGMMGGGYGPGMMGGGMMGGGPLYMLGLSDEQTAKVNQIRDESRRKNWDTMGKMLDESARMRDLMSADKRDPAAIGKQSMKLAELRRQMLEASIESQNRIDALLSKEQKDQLRSWRRNWMQADE